MLDFQLRVLNPVGKTVTQSGQVHGLNLQVGIDALSGQDVGQIIGVVERIVVGAST